MIPGLHREVSTLATDTTRQASPQHMGADSGLGDGRPSELCGHTWLYWLRQRASSTFACSSVSNISRASSSSRRLSL